MKPNVDFTLGEMVPLRWEDGPISLGLVLSMSVVNWSGPRARDLLIGRCWEGIFLYAERDLLRGEWLEPIQLFAGLGDVHAVPVGGNKESRVGILACNLTGFLYSIAQGIRSGWPTCP